MTSWSTAFDVLGKGERRQALKTPEQRMHEDIAENIRRAGQHIAAVFPRRGESGEHFFYTIGNAERRLPELLLIGNFSPEIVMHALNLLAEKMRKSEKPLPEGMVDIGWNLPFKVRKAGPAARADYTCQVDRYYRGVDYDVLQVMFCDRKGRYQDDPKSDYASPTP